MTPYLVAAARRRFRGSPEPAKPTSASAPDRPSSIVRPESANNNSAKKKRSTSAGSRSAGPRVEPMTELPRRPRIEITKTNWRRRRRRPHLRSRGRLPSHRPGPSSGSSRLKMASRRQPRARVRAANQVNAAIAVDPVASQPAVAPTFRSPSSLQNLRTNNSTKTRLRSAAAAPPERASA